MKCPVCGHTLCLALLLGPDDDRELQATREAWEDAEQASLLREARASHVAARQHPRYGRGGDPRENDEW